MGVHIFVETKQMVPLKWVTDLQIIQTEFLEIKKKYV